MVMMMVVLASLLIVWEDQLGSRISFFHANPKLGTNNNKHEEEEQHADRHDPPLSSLHAFIMINILEVNVPSLYEGENFFWACNNCFRTIYGMVKRRFVKVVFGIFSALSCFSKKREATLVPLRGSTVGKIIQTCINLGPVCDQQNGLEKR